MLLSLGFTQGESCPNVFWHQAKDIYCSVHGDDFTSSGACPELGWMEAEIANHYGITIQPRMGPGPSDAKDGRSVNRAVRWPDGRIEHEADPRQSERLISECGLDGSNGVATPWGEAHLYRTRSGHRACHEAPHCVPGVRGPR